METFLLSVTENAKEYLNNVRNGKSVKLGIKASGCNGYAYVISLIDKKEEDFIFNDIPFAVDGESFKGLNQCEIDYQKDGFSSKIVFNNPNVTHSCGCGESFTLK